MKGNIASESFFWTESLNEKEDINIHLGYNWQNYNYLYCDLECILDGLSRAFRNRKSIIKFNIPDSVNAGISRPFLRDKNWSCFIQAFLQCENELSSITKMPEFSDLEDLRPYIKQNVYHVSSRQANNEEFKKLFSEAFGFPPKRYKYNLEKDLKLDPYEKGKTYFSKDLDVFSQKQLNLLAEEHVSFVKNPRLIRLFPIFRVIRNNNAHMHQKIPPRLFSNLEKRIRENKKSEHRYERGERIIKIVYPLLKKCVKILNNKKFMAYDRSECASGKWNEYASGEWIFSVPENSVNGF